MYYFQHFEITLVIIQTFLLLLKAIFQTSSKEFEINRIFNYICSSVHLVPFLTKEIKFLKRIYVRLSKIFLDAFDANDLFIKFLKKLINAPNPLKYFILSFIQFSNYLLTLRSFNKGLYKSLNLFYFFKMMILNIFIPAYLIKFFDYKINCSLYNLFKTLP